MKHDSHNIAEARIDAACGDVVRGRLAERLLATWSGECGLGECEFRLLWVVGDAERPLDQRQLAEQLAASPAQVSGLVERLRQRGLLSVEAGAGDRRRRLCRLTLSGRELVEQVVTTVGRELAPPLPCPAPSNLEAA